MAHIFVKYDRTQKLREKNLDNEWLYIMKKQPTRKQLAMIR